MQVSATHPRALEGRSNAAYLMQFTEIPHRRSLSAWNSSGMVNSSLREVEVMVTEEKGGRRDRPRSSLRAVISAKGGLMLCC